MARRIKNNRFLILTLVVFSFSFGATIGRVTADNIVRSGTNAFLEISASESNLIIKGFQFVLSLLSYSL